MLYQKIYKEMVGAHASEFEEFRKISDLYKQDQNKWQGEFDRIGKPLLRIIEEHENRLCGKMEGAGRGTYSANLAEKFRGEIKKNFPLIDFIGVKVE